MVIQEPSNGGKECVGNDTRYEDCNIDPCPGNSRKCGYNLMHSIL